MTRPTVRILGTHGVPANYGGFETAAENVGLYLARNGWRVIVYCQVEGRGSITYDEWNGLERVNVPVSLPGWRGTSLFDSICIRHAAKYRDVCLTFGYNTAVFDTLLRAKRIPNVINMDGIEWSRERWGFMKQAILWSNERAGFYVGDHLIADHPELVPYLSQRSRPEKVSMITYGADTVEDAPADLLEPYGLRPGGYASLICRPIPENSLLELVAGFSARPRGIELAVLGTLTPDEDPYHAAVIGAASPEVRFLGAIYDKPVVQALRFHSVAYLHGHTVGGTNPSLVEALAAGNPVLAHDNPYNRWVAQDAAVYFADVTDVDRELTAMLRDDQQRALMSKAARERHAEEFTWEYVAGQYEDLLRRYLDPSSRAQEAPGSSPVPGKDWLS